MKKKNNSDLDLLVLALFILSCTFVIAMIFFVLK